MNTTAKSIIHGIGAFLLMGVASLVNLIPHSIEIMSVGGVATAVIVAVGNYLENF